MGWLPDVSTQTSLFIPAQQFAATSGSPVMGTSGAVAAIMLFDQTGTEAASAFVQVPAGWVSYDIELWFVNAAASAGNVVWRCDRSNLGFGGGETIDPATAGTQRTEAANATANVVTVTTMDSAISAPTAGEMLTLRIRRIGGDAADTLANDAGLVGLRLVKAS